MCKKFGIFGRLNICSKYRACIFWACVNICCGCAFIALLVKFEINESLPISIVVISCICGLCFTTSGILLLIGVLKGIRWLVCSSIVFCSLGIVFIHWLIIPFVIYFLFSFIVFNYYQVDMCPDDRFQVREN